MALAFGAALGPAGGAARAATDAGNAARAVIDPARLPAPGSYRLPRIMAAPDGEVLMPTGQPARLHRVLRGSLSVVSFIYSYCRDPEGCPRAWAVKNLPFCCPIPMAHELSKWPKNCACCFAA